ncbi:shikimate dehydrogenase [Salinimicrobium sediminis]|uniref:Shikimate dehydrogenase n=1 Tax=Salinimicrobium sediminis TaxID=1343891 RepID=A0A285X7J1_9FLAO|nr:shikimate dehydrogenase [Salinimicrobium sediminis]SOC81303.1 shikimate dehydrogenase [Salinimicrobium sediminis]
MRRFGLLGRNISYSFSRTYFTQKFAAEGIEAVYENFDLQHISEFPEVLRKHPDLKGLNVTIPYKEEIFSFLDRLDPEASTIGAVNTIRFENNGSLSGFNTDYVGFTSAIKPFLKPHHQNALILGTGGASKAVHYALKKLKINPLFVSRNPSENSILYEHISSELLKEYTAIINTTPLGTFPKTEEIPAIPVEFLSKQHLVFDLVYNPPETRLMQLARQQGATVLNGQKMLELQAEKAWEIWNRS